MMKKKIDEAHAATEKTLTELEQRIARMYGDASKELQAQIDAYFKSFEKRDAKMKEMLDRAEITEQDYKQWRLAQIGRGKRFEALRDKLAERMTNANEVAVSYVNDATPGIYSLNRNYAAYTIEQVAGNCDFTLFDEQTVKRLIVDEPDLMPNYPPEKAVKRGIDLAYGKKQITSSVTSAILQGKGLKSMADDLQTRINTMSRTSAIRTARTAVTGAQNAGRIDSYAAAEKRGIKLKKEWVATLDGRTRHSHGAIDGERVENDKKFSNGCMYPGDPNGRPEEIYNCRCVVSADVDDSEGRKGQRRAIDPVTGKSVLIENMTYSEWVEWKKAENPEDWEAYIKKTKNRSSDEKQYAQYKAVLGKRIPNSSDEFRKMKYNNSEWWDFVKLDKSRRDRLNKYPSLALPGEKKIIPDGKFEGYLFNPDNRKGYAKGQAITSRLGYSAENWRAMQSEIRSCVEKYPAIKKDSTEYGDRYEQKIVLYGKNNNPANVVVGWIVKPDGTTSMTSAYIKEV